MEFNSSAVNPKQQSETIRFIVIRKSHYSEGCYSEKIYRKSQSYQDLIWNGQNTSRILLEQMTEVSNVEYFDSIGTIINSVTQNSGPVVNCDNESFEIIKPHCSDKIIVEDITHHFNSIEIIKNANLIENYRKSVEIASNALIKCMKKSTEEFTNEIELDEEFAYQCSKSGAECLAYPPVVASGSNSTAIHYLRKTDKMINGDLILMDAGCRFGGACSDLTRTWPKNKKFTEKQACVYQIVLDAQKLCFEMLSSSKDVTLRQLMVSTLYLIGKQMCESNIVKKTVYSFKELVQIGQRYCPHHIGHHIGNYLHDCHKIFGSDDIVLGNNMCFTIEPGIYIQKDDEQVNPEFRGIGIRIEDCCLINDNGEFEVLSKRVPREIKDIEQFLS
ncbi:MAG: Xaa-Pro aminopeptidase 3 [Marteilia pararefringens]